MAVYAKVDIRLWNDKKVRKLAQIPPCGQGLWIHLLVSEHKTSLPGVLKVGEAALAEELGWSLEAFREAFAEAASLGMVKADWKARFVWVPNACKYNPPESANVVKSWRIPWDEAPECDLKNEAHGVLKAFLKGFHQSFQDAFTEACPEPSPNQEQYQEQEQEEDLCPPAEAGGPAELTLDFAEAQPEPPEPPEPTEADQVRAVFAHYRAKHPRAFIDPQPGTKEWRLILARLKEGSTVEDMCDAIDGYHLSPHHQGFNDRGTKYLGLELMVRDGTHVQQGLQFKAHPPKPRQPFARASGEARPPRRADTPPKTRAQLESEQREAAAVAERKAREFREARAADVGGLVERIAAAKGAAG